MKTEKGKPNYKLPDDFGELLGAVICDLNPFGAMTPLRFHRPLDFKELTKGKERLWGRPTDMTIFEGEFHLWPVPDQVFTFEGDYVGHRRRF